MDTIVAISTAPGVGGIGIIRLSGKECFEILNTIFKPKKYEELQNINGYTIKYGNIINFNNNEIIDEVLVSYFKEPNSYTKENMCEINSHGGTIVMRKILELCLKNGAQMAEPGEFTKRAFLNGRIDLSQAEAVVDIINSKTEKESSAALNQLEGFLSKEVIKIKQSLLEVMTSIEVMIDYPEYEIDEIKNLNIEEKLENIKEKLKILENTFYDGKILKDGIKVAIIGKPNAGKSSLLNAILKEDRAIVTEYEGTTRDTIEEFINIDGIPIKIIDTAGIREAKDEVEKIGIEKAKKTIEKADLIISIFDITKKIDDEDEKLLNLIKNKKAIIVLNKKDLILKDLNIDKKLLDTNKRILEISALHKEGIQELNKEISKMFELDEIKVEESAIVTNARHKNLINQALEHTNQSIIEIKENMPIDIVAIEIKEVLESLCSITGENVSEDIIKEIFSKFCLGK